MNYFKKMWNMVKLLRVKIGDKIYSGFEQPIMLIFDTNEKELISSMTDEDARYCEYPDDYEGNIDEWMDDYEN